MNKANKKELEEEVQTLKSDIMLLIEEIDRINQRIINMNHKFEKKIENIHATQILLGQTRSYENGNV
tara:strand:- start:486 stop:686 length:201 start_codon:yes stop_codon:yes gene_type:complete